MKTSRLFEIMTILLNKGTTTARELAERFQVSTRTVYRDIDALSAAGVPVYMNKGKGGGIYLLENYTINRTLISAQESESLLLAVKTLQATQYPEIDRILEKLGAIFKNAAAQDWVEVDFSPWGSAASEQNKFNDIRQALLQRKVLRFQYVNAKGWRSARCIEPEKLVFKDNAWYLTAFCRQRQAYRTFRISRIKQMEILPEVFAAKACSKPENGTDSSVRPLVSLKLRFQPQALNRLYDYFDDTYIIPMEEGCFVLEIALPDDEWIDGYILSFGSLVEVLEPEYVRKRVIEKMKQALHIYDS